MWDRIGDGIVYPRALRAAQAARSFAPPANSILIEWSPYITAFPVGDAIAGGETMATVPNLSCRPPYAASCDKEERAIRVGHAIACGHTIPLKKFARVPVARNV
jgi:hypothetical protein